MPDNRGASSVWRVIAVVLLSMLVAVPAARADGTLGPPVPHALGDPVRGIAAGDLSGDGDPELFASSNFPPALHVIGGAAGRAFTPGLPLTPAARQIGDVAVADFDGDGDLDAAAGDLDPSAFVVRNTPGAFTVTAFPVGAVGPDQLAVGDLNGDGDPELVALACCASQSSGIYVLTGAADATFTGNPRVVTNDRPGDVVLADVDDDGDLDVIVTVVFFAPELTLHLNDGSGGLGAGVPVPAGVFASELAVGDLNGDGDPDIVAGAGDSLSVVLGGPGATFASPLTRQLPSTSVELADLDLDGRLDLIAGGPPDIRVALGDGAGGFGPAVAYPVGNGPGQIAAADFDGDGDPDVAYATDSGVAVRGNLPGVPQPSRTTPASPSTDTTPLIGGRADPNATVALYGNATCTGTPLATGSAADFNGAGIGIAVAPERETLVWAAASAGGDTSACSPQPVAYTHATPRQSPPPPGPPPPGPPPPPPALCGGRTVTLLDVAPAGRRVRIAGLTLAGNAGRTVEITTGGRRVGEATVRADGTFATTVRAPSARQRARIRYVAAIGDAASRAFKLERRMVITSRKKVAGGLHLTGRLQAGARRARALIVSRQLTCTAAERYARVRVRRNGRFALTLPAAPGELAIYRLRAALGRNATFTLPVAVPAR